MIEINNKKLCESCFCETDEAICPHCGFSAAEYTADPLVLPMGAKLNDKIIIGRVMGKGGFGVTYLGYDLRMDKIIAVKEYYPNGIAYRLPSGTEVSVADTKSSETFDKGAEKFYAEAEMVAQFNGNPNIVSVYDYFKANNTVYLIMEYISGITLKNYIKKHGRLTDGQALYVMDKIAAALSITHSAGVLHRDISPDNIMICRDGKVKLIDFGAARQIISESSSNLTVVMKPGYTPIEQYTKKGWQGAWTDIYSLGVSVYYALTEVIIDDPYARMDDDSELDENRHGVNDDLWAILKKCTMINASDRYGSAIDLRKALKSVSAPIKSEPIALTDDDLKSDSNSNAPVVPDEITSGKEIPLTTVAPVSKASESIEVFEDSIAAPPAADYTAVKKIPDKGKRKKIIIGSVCAAAVILLGIFAIGLAGNNRHEPNDRDMITSDVSVTSGTVSETETKKETDSSPKETTQTQVEYVPEKINGAIVLDDNDLYWSMAKSIPKSALEAFDGDIKVTLKIEPLGNGDYPYLRILDGSAKDVDVNAFPAVKNEWNEFDVHDINEFVFVISHELVESISKKSTAKISFKTNNVIIKSVTLEDDCDPEPYKTIELESEYAGDWSAGKFIPKSDLAKAGGDVRVYLDVSVALYGDENDNYRHLNIINENWTGVPVSVRNLAPLEDSMYEFFDTGEGQFVFTISEDEIQKLTEYGLGFQIHNVIVKSAALEAVSKENDSSSAELPADEPTVTTYLKATASDLMPTATAEPEKIEKPLYIPLSTEYPGRWNSDRVNTLHKKYLKDFTGDIKVTLDIELVYVDKNDDGGYWHNFKITDGNENLANVYAFNTGRSRLENYSMYEGQTKFAFIVKRADIAKAYDELRFSVENLIVKGATVEDYDPNDDKINPNAKIIQMDSEYQGYWKPSSFIPKKELENFGGDVRVTLNLDIVKQDLVPEDSEYNEHWVQILPHGSKKHEQYWVTIKADYVYPCPWYDHMYLLYDVNVPDKFTFVISRSEIENLGDDGLYFKGENFIIKSAALENA